MSYNRYITGIYKSYWPELNRTLRSSSVPRTVPDSDPARYVRGTSMPPTAYYTTTPSPQVASCFYSMHRGRTSASPFAERAASVPTTVPRRTFSLGTAAATSSSSSTAYSHYSDFDYKVMSYTAQLDAQEAARASVSRAVTRLYPAGSFSSRYDYYAGDKHGTDGLYPCSREVLGTWKHFNRSADTLRARNQRGRSPLASRELDRYYETSKRSNYIGDISAGGACDFRYYNYRRVPYFGGSDNYSYMKQPNFRKNSRGLF